MMSTVKIIPLSASHVESMADVVADLNIQSPGSGPVSRLGERRLAASAVAAIGSRPGVVAIAGSSVVGFMIASLPDTPGPTTARLSAAHHAARPAYARPVYRRLYEATANRLVAAGCTYHSLPMPVGATEAVVAFFELGFGVDQIKGAVAVGDYVRSSSGSDGVRAASAADVDQVLALAIELTKFHSRTPMFQAAILDVPSIRRSVERAIEDDASTVLVMDDGARLLAMMSAEPDRAYAESVVIGMNVVTESARCAGVGTALLDALIGWAAETGYRHCTVGWTSSNLISDAFYRSRGFVPIRYRLHRRIDPRVAWANDALDYTPFT